MTPRGPGAATVTPSRALVTQLARLLALTQTRRGRHIGHDIELCQWREAFRGIPAQACSPRCQAVQDALEEAARYLGVEVEDLKGWPKKMREPALALDVSARTLGLWAGEGAG